jgi:hypothetical protein
LEDLFFLTPNIPPYFWLFDSMPANMLLNCSRFYNAAKLQRSKRIVIT